MNKIVLDLNHKIYNSWEFSYELIQSLIALSQTDDFYVEYSPQMFISCDYYFDESMCENGILQSLCIKLKNGKLVGDRSIEFEYEMLNTKGTDQFLTIKEPFLWINGIYSSGYSQGMTWSNFTFGSAWVTERTI